MKYLLLILPLLLIACDGTYQIEAEDSEHIAYVSVAESWREICQDRFNEYMDYPVEEGETCEEAQAECRRRFASGEEELDIPELPGEIPPIPEGVL